MIMNYSNPIPIRVWFQLDNGSNGYTRILESYDFTIQIGIFIRGPDLSFFFPQWSFFPKKIEELELFRDFKFHLRYKPLKLTQFSFLDGWLKYIWDLHCVYLEEAVRYIFCTIWFVCNLAKVRYFLISWEICQKVPPIGYLRLVIPHADCRMIVYDYSGLRKLAAEFLVS